jgi:hypothetical protein
MSRRELDRPQLVGRDLWRVVCADLQQRSKLCASRQHHRQHSLCGLVRHDVGSFSHWAELREHEAEPGFHRCGVPGKYDDRRESRDEFQRVYELRLIQYSAEGREWKPDYRLNDVSAALIYQSHSSQFHDQSELQRIDHGVRYSHPQHLFERQRPVRLHLLGWNWYRIVDLRRRCRGTLFGDSGSFKHRRLDHANVPHRGDHRPANHFACHVHRMTPYIPVLDRKQQTNGFYTQHEFIPVPDENAYLCPGGELLSYSGLSRGAQGYVFRGKPLQCAGCSHKPACTPATHRTLTVNWYEGVREHVRKLSQTPEFAAARRARNKIEALFSELRNQVRLRKVRLRGLHNAKEQFILAATAQNVKRLINRTSQV